MVDTTIPGISAEIVQPDVARPVGTAGKIAIVGKFEKGDYNTPYFFDNPRAAGNVMGTSAAYSGTNIINYVFAQDLDQSNYGASSIICVKAGATAKAVYVVNTSGAAAVMHLAAITGGTWANGAATGLEITIGAGTLSIASTYHLTLKLNGVVVEDYDNQTTTQLMNNINAYSQYITCTATTAELAGTPATVTDASFAGGSETSSPTTSDMTAALATLLTENFDILIFTDAPDSTYFSTISTWLNSKLAIDKPCKCYLPIATTNSVSQAMVIGTAINQMFISYIYQTFTIGNDTLTSAESCARYAGFVAGLPVEESPTNKIMNDITGLNTIFSKGNSGDEYNLTTSGITVFSLKNRQNSTYGIVSAVTASTTVDDTGRKTDASEEHAVRTLLYVLNYLNLETWEGQTGITKTIDSINGELGNRAAAIVASDVLETADDLVYNVSSDPADSKVADIDISVRAKGIIKHIHYRIKLMMGGN